ncbi:alpha/beta hydrolase [Microcella sp.]|uniref:alpha/beta hydrolase n=1 Tax=Microcella sp. TaxID=1913979 RepID=UPI0025673C73|nr:alpha/beta hydrolase [Microcella sp.]MBX9472400.1 alpha/beta hydrolase [Microcella sp.]
MSPDALPTVDLDEWPHLFIEGASAVAPVVLTLHGTGGDEREIVALGEAVAPGAAVLSPRGRVREGLANRWFRRLGEGVFDVDDVIVRAAELAAFVVAARSRYALEGRELIAAGFSNGANIALATALLHPDVVSRVVAFSGMYPFGDREPGGSSPGLELLLLGGDHDPMAPATSVDRLEAFASARGASVTRHRRPGGHGIEAGELQFAKEWLAR